MKIYLSGWFGGDDNYLSRELIKAKGYKLCSYAYPKQATDYLEIADELGIRASVMIDSGAFTAWTGGKPIKLKDLIAYCKKLLNKYWERHDFIFISLDVMAGEKNRLPTTSELKEAMDISYDNYLVFQQELSSNYTVMPVYHSGEPESFRDKFLQHTDHICLSMNQSMSEKDRVSWAGRNQISGVKLHGLAATGVQMIKYVDWYSVDSAKWLIAAAMGTIFWPMPDKGISLLNVSSESPTVKKKNMHLKNKTMSNELRDVIVAKGFSVDDIMNKPVTRMDWNMRVWLTHNWPKKVIKQEGLFLD